MGRTGSAPGNFAGLNVHFEAMKMYDGDYDKGGAYWGAGSFDSGYMYTAWAFDDDGDVLIHYFRAKTDDGAKHYLRNELGVAGIEMQKKPVVNKEPVNKEPEICLSREQFLQLLEAMHQIDSEFLGDYAFKKPGVLSVRLKDNSFVDSIDLNESGGDYFEFNSFIEKVNLLFKDTVAERNLRIKKEEVRKKASSILSKHLTPEELKLLDK